METMQSHSFDLFVVVAYGKILPEKLINLPPFGTVNVHYSLLPKYRGATPVESAILNGDSETGVCIQKMQYKLDSGPILALEKFTIPHNITTPKLRDQLNLQASTLLPETIRHYVRNEIIPTPQDESGVTLCTKIEKEDGLLDPDGHSILNDRKFRAYFGWPGSYFFVKQGERGIRVIIKDAELLDGVFTIKSVIPEGKKEMPYEVFKKTL
jgi:methionyl-tRNA formyltransferase